MKLSTTQIALLALLLIYKGPALFFHISPATQQQLFDICFQVSAILGISNLFVNPNGSPAVCAWTPAQHEECQK